MSKVRVGDFARAVRDKEAAAHREEMRVLGFADAVIQEEPYLAVLEGRRTTARHRT